MHDLPNGARRLLALRVGLDGPARSPAATARILRVSNVRERRLERRALRLLRQSAISGCAGPAASVHNAEHGAAGSEIGGETAAVSSVPTGAVGAAGAGGPAASLRSARTIRAPRGGRRLGAGAVPQAANVEQAGAGSSSASGVFFAALFALLLGLGLIALPDVRRRLLPAGAATGARPRPVASPSPPSSAGPSAAAGPGRHALPPPPRFSHKMDEGMALMAADVFAQLTRDPADRVPQPEAEAEARNAQPEVEEKPDQEPRG